MDLEVWSKNGCGVENCIFWSEIGYGFGEPGGTLPPTIPRGTHLLVGHEVYTDTCIGLHVVFNI